MTSAGTVENPAVDRIVRVVGSGDALGLRFTAIDATDDDAFDHACVEADGCLVVPDAASDVRFAGTEVRFYAGVAVHDPEGEPVGTIAVRDTAPRPELDAALRHQLLALRSAAEELIAAHRRVAFDQAG